MISSSSILLVIVPLLAMASCVAERPRESGENVIQHMMKGKTRQELLACAGEPIREEFQGSGVQLIYYKEASLLEESFPGSKSSMSRIHHGCRAAVLIENERIRSIQYQSVPDYFHDEDHCDEIFETCTMLQSVP